MSKDKAQTRRAESITGAARRIRKEWWPHLEPTGATALSIKQKLAVVISENVQPEMERLRSAIQQTLDENGHLADGDNCTLIHLKRAIGVS